jgi:acylphosphatase
MSIVCKRVTYSGRVQGVGFRYTAQALAAKYPVAGSVRNLSNGQVELVAEGEAAFVDAFLAAVANQMARCIEDTVTVDEVLTGQRGFVIRH